jgi:hypothetical protein
VSLGFKESLQHLPKRRRCDAAAETSGEGPVLGTDTGRC